MNKTFIVALLCLIASGCSKFRQEETPIDGTDGLVTYTAPNTSSVGIKQAGSKNVLTPPVYTCVHSCFEYLIAEREPDANDEVAFDLLDGISAAPLTDLSYDGIMAIAEGFVLEDADELYFLARGSRTPVGPKQQVFILDSLVFTQSGGKWGINGITDDKYDRIAIVRQNNASGFRLVVQEEKNYTLLDANGQKLQNNLSPAIFAKLGKMSQKFADKKWGNDTVFGMTVADYKAAF